jgi:hypothetical protein
MLLERDVVKAVSGKLRSRGYITHELDTPRHGDDIIAERMAITRKLYIEAKGATSSRKSSKRFGKPFNKAQVRTHVAMAFYKAAEALSRKDENIEVRAGIALPDNSDHRDAVQKIISILHRLDIAIFWVRENGRVYIDSTWEV